MNRRDPESAEKLLPMTPPRLLGLIYPSQSISVSSLIKEAVVCILMSNSVRVS
jgi:hypothetical protein